MKRRYDYDVLRAAAMAAVIYLHTAANSLRNLDNHVLWNFSNVVSVLCTPAVPLFFMMSGALLLSDERTGDPRHIFHRRLPKVLIPLCVWSALILLYYVCSGNTAAAAEAAKKLFNTPVIVPYWFLYALIPMYLLSPLLKVMTDHLSDHQWNYMMGLWMVVTLGSRTVKAFLPAAWQQVVTESSLFTVSVVGGYLGYFLLGAYLERQEHLPSKRTLALTAVGMAAVIILITRYFTFARESYTDGFVSYLALFMMILSVSLFLLAKSCLRGRDERGRLLPLLAGNSFCVYLIHPMALEICRWLWHRSTGAYLLSTPRQQILLFGGTFLLSLAGSMVLSSIPGLCMLFTGQTWKEACKSSNLFALFRKRTD